MLIPLLIVMLGTLDPNLLDESKRTAETFLKSFIADPKSIGPLATRDALFATIDNRWPLTDIIKDPGDLKATLQSCAMGPVTTASLDKASVQNLPGDTFKSDGPFVQAEAPFFCSTPDHVKIAAKALLVMKGGKVAFLGIYPSREH